jgi:Nidogen-like
VAYSIERSIAKCRQAGFDAGDGIVYYLLPGALTQNILQLAQSSNVGLVGRWMFRVDGLNVLLPNYPEPSIYIIQKPQAAPGSIHRFRITCHSSGTAHRSVRYMVFMHLQLFDGSATVVWT